jgi:glycosyltransferase involved in cell wall biosynthesis
MTRAIFVTQRVDPAHPNLGAVVPMIAALARQVDEVTVFALFAVDGALPANCRVRTFDARFQLERGVRFEAALARELSPRPRAVIAHMSPIYAVLAAPLCRPLGIPLVLWFTHWRASPLLRVAERVSTAVATVDRSSFPLPSAKVHAIGHGIPVDELACRPDPDGAPTLRVLALGRTSPAKALQTIVAGVRLARQLGAAVELDIRGPSETGEERVERERLIALSGDGVRVLDAVPRNELAAVLRETDLVVNAAAPGALDKSVFEACASCVPVLASNPGFADLLPPELRFTRDDVSELAEKLFAFAGLEPAARASIGHELRRRVEAEHSADNWARSVLALAAR